MSDIFDIEGDGGLSRVPPHSKEAEEACLGAALQSEAALETVCDTLSPDDFLIQKNKVLFSKILEFKQKNNAQLVSDRVSFYEFLRSTGTLDNVLGGVSEVERIVESAPTASNAENYCKIVKEHSLRRKIITFAEHLRDDAYDKSKDANNTIDRACQDATELSSIGLRGESFKYLRDVSEDVMQDIISQSEEKRTGQLGRLGGIETNFSLLDKYMGGLRRSSYVVIAARPSVGKTAFALSMMLNVLLRDRQKRANDPSMPGDPIGVGFFSLEMSTEQIVTRLLSMVSGVQQDKLNNFNVSEHEAKRLSEAIEKLYDLNLMIEENSRLTIGDIKSEARKMKKAKAQAIFIDYIGIITPDDKYKKESRFDQVARHSREIKAMAKELKLPVVVLCQLNREAESGAPNLANLRESGSIEQDADVVIMLHSPDREANAQKQKSSKASDIPVMPVPLDLSDFAPDKGVNVNDRQNLVDLKRIHVMVAKNRNGRTGEFDLGFARDVVYYCDLKSEVSN